jgi:glycosyltransferase involved in cell wall biosynthesis
LNEETTQELLAAGFQPDRIVPMANGIDAEKYRVRSDYTLGIPPRLVFVGRLEPQKDVATFLQALALTSRSDFQALIVGDGPQRQCLEEMACELGLRERTAFCGRVSDVIPFLQEADLFVLPSLSEGISNALLEAMSCGLPCLVTDIPGNRAVITDGIDGHLFTPGSPETLAQLLTTLLADASLRRRTGQAARKTVTQRFSMSAVVEAYLRLYCQLTSRPEIYLEQTKRGNYVWH